MKDSSLHNIMPEWLLPDKAPFISLGGMEFVRSIILMSYICILTGLQWRKQLKSFDEYTERLCDSAYGCSSFPSNFFPVIIEK